MQVVAQGMIEKGQGGSIVNVSSTAAAIAFPRVSVYSMSKVALDMLTQCMALELGKHKVCHKNLCVRKRLFNSLPPSVYFHIRFRTVYLICKAYKTKKDNIYVLLSFYYFVRFANQINSSEYESVSQHW